MRPKDEGKIQAIFDAVISLSGEVGIAGLKMSAIAKHAKLASGTLYVYFDNKEELLNKLYEHLIKGGTLAVLPDLSHLPIKSQLFNIWWHVVQFRVSNNAQVVFMNQFRISPYITDEAKRLDNQFVDHILNLLDAGKKELIIKDVDNLLLFSVMYGYVNELCQNLAAQKAKVTEPLIKQTFQICWDAIKA